MSKGSKNNATKVCIIIPAYNEATSIADVIAGVKKAFSDTNYIVEVVVVNDGSKDNTAHIANKAGASVISHILNSGAGGATATGVRYAYQHGFDVAATMDADGQHKPEDVARGIKLLLDTNSDLLIGSRLIDSAGMSRLKIVGNKGLSFITFALFGVSSTDSQSGLRVFSKSALKNLRWKTSGYEFCSEMLWRAKQSKLSVNEYPIEAIYTDYSKAKGQSNWNAVNIIGALLKRRILEIMHE